LNVSKLLSKSDDVILI